jgi:Porin PorA
MRRRAIGLALAGLGAFLLVAALLTRSYVAGQLVKFPLNTYVKTTLIGKDVSYFSPKLVRPVSGATMQVTDTVKGDAAAGSSSTAVWDEFTYLYDRTNHVVFSYTTRRAAFDRRTAVLVDCCGANIGGNAAIRQTGLSGYVWPFGTQKRTYDVFDTTLLKPMPFRYAGTGTIHGISVYRFVEHVPPTQSGTQQVPGSLVGSSQNLVTLPEYYTATSTYWVDPRTGGVLDSTSDSKQYLRNTTGQDLVLFSGDLVMTPASVDTAVGLDITGRTELDWFEVIGPLIGALAGLVLLVTGIVLARLRPGEQPQEARDTEPEPALGPAR